MAGGSQALPVTRHIAVEVFQGVLGDFLPIVGDGGIHVIQVLLLLLESQDERVIGRKIFDLRVADHVSDYINGETDASGTFYVVMSV